jgi:type II secretory ATPase GspE/PulE/Tfp pilus assembly ATPase PilB-like protein
MTILLLAVSVSDGTGYINLFKAGTAVVLLLAWARAAQWIDRDTDFVKTKREQWNMIVLAGAAVAYVVFFIPPWSGGLFILGIAFWLLIAGGSMLAYLVHRNARVVPDARVLTLGHAKRLLRRGGGRQAASDKGLRVRIHDHAGKFVEAPRDAVEAKTFDAAQDFLHDILWKRANDVEMVAGKEGYRVLFRIDGVAAERPDGMPLEEGERLIRFFKKTAGLNVEEIRRPQSGKIQAGLLSQSGDPPKTEVRTSGSTAGERLSLHVQTGPVLMRFNELGMAPARHEALKQCLGRPVGLLLISAPPRNGLTTTQYAILRSHDAYMNNIHALERRKLVDLDNITQQIYEGANTDVNYARMLQSVLRREPDIVLVGECEDRETAKIATRAAADDRKIYLGMHARDTFDALNKYLTMAEDNAVAAKALLGVTNQRLIRALCKDCREAFQPDAATLKKLNLPADKIERFYRPPSEPKLNRRGKPIICQTCQGTGYVGRTGVFEVLIVDAAVSKLIAEGAGIEKIKAQCRKNKMHYLQEEALLKVIDGTTSMNEVLRCLSSNEKAGGG